MGGKKEPKHFGLGEIAMREGRKEKRQQSWIDMNSGRGEKELVKGMGRERGKENDREPFPPRRVGW